MHVDTHEDQTNAAPLPSTMHKFRQAEIYVVFLVKSIRSLGVAVISYLFAVMNEQGREDSTGQANPRSILSTLAYQDP